MSYRKLSDTFAFKSAVTDPTPAKVAKVAKVAKAEDSRGVQRLKARAKVG